MVQFPIQFSDKGSFMVVRYHSSKTYSEPRTSSVFMCSAPHLHPSRSPGHPPSPHPAAQSPVAAHIRLRASNSRMKPLLPSASTFLFAATLMPALLPVTLAARTLSAEPVTARYLQGTAHGFLALSTLDGKRIAIGDLNQFVRGNRVISHLKFRFRDGSIDDDTTIFTQHGVLRLISDHHIQRGPAFPNPSDIFIDAVSGQVTTRRQDGTLSQTHLDIPPDVANGLPPNLLMNLDPSTPETVLSYVAPTTKPSLIHISIKPAGKVPFTVGGEPRQAVDYVIHVELGGIKAVIAPVVGKQPADTHIWVLPGVAPAFIREEGQLFEGGPIWRIEQISPAFPH
jgi:hypothetical protein